MQCLYCVTDAGLSNRYLWYKLVFYELVVTDPLDEPDTAWKYHSWNDLDGYPHMGKMGTYSGGGYVASLGHSYEQGKAVIEELIEHRWLDEYTRIIFIEFLTYNPNINLFGVSMSAVEFLDTGGK